MAIITTTTNKKILYLKTQKCIGFFFSDIWPLRTKIGIYLNVYRELDQDFGNLRLKQILSECTKAEFIAKCKYGIQILALGIISKLDNIKNGKNVGHIHSTQYLLLKYLAIYCMYVKN